MKKTLVSAITTALVVGAASTTFAAANPFSDVPADHWAYDAVAQLAQDGVVNGYGDGTYRGQKNITRYEMAQIIAKAMAKTDVSAADKAKIDKLAAEFSDELSNLGVRVAGLEKKVDNVKWKGFVRYEYVTRNRGYAPSSWKKQHMLMRLEPSMQINKNWTGHARMEYGVSTNSGTNLTYGPSQGGYREDFSHVNLLYAEGKYGTTDIKLGRFKTYSKPTHGLAADNFVTGAQVAFGKNLKVQLAAGRYNWYGDQKNSWIKDNPDTADGCNYDYKSASYMSADVSYAKGKFDTGIGYREYHGSTFCRDVYGQFNDTHKSRYSDGDNTIADVDFGIGYHFTPTLYFNADYAAATKAGNKLTSDYKKSYNIQLSYKTMNPAKKGSFGIWVAYRHIANTVTITPTYMCNTYSNEQGWNFGFKYAFAKNITGDVEYYKARAFEAPANGDDNVSKLYTNVTFLF